MTNRLKLKQRLPDFSSGERTYHMQAEDRTTMMFWLQELQVVLIHFMMNHNYMMVTIMTLLPFLFWFIYQSGRLRNLATASVDK